MEICWIYSTVALLATSASFIFNMKQFNIIEHEWKLVYLLTKREFSSSFRPCIYDLSPAIQPFGPLLPTTLRCSSSYVYLLFFCEISTKTLKAVNWNISYTFTLENRSPLHHWHSNTWNHLMRGERRSFTFINAWKCAVGALAGWVEETAPSSWPQSSLFVRSPLYANSDKRNATGAVGRPAPGEEVLSCISILFSIETFNCGQYAGLVLCFRRLAWLLDVFLDLWIKYINGTILDPYLSNASCPHR